MPKRILQGTVTSNAADKNYYSFSGAFRKTPNFG